MCPDSTPTTIPRQGRRPPGRRGRRESVAPGGRTLRLGSRQDYRFDCWRILRVGKLRGQRFEARFVGIEAADLLDRLPGVVQHTSFDCDGGAKQAAFDPPPSHPHLEALPLLRGSVGLQHGAIECKLRTHPRIGRCPWSGTALFLLVVQFVVFGGQFVLFGGGRDVVDVDLLVLGAPVLVGVIKTADRTLLDGAARTAVAVFARGLALVLGGRVRAEVAVALTGRRRAAGVGPWSETAQAVARSRPAAGRRAPGGDRPAVDRKSRQAVEGRPARAPRADAPRSRQGAGL